MKFPIGIQDFKKVITEDYLYIDKTALIYQLVKGGSIYFLSRPRRFGKSLLVSTLEYYFKGERELFKGLAIDALEKDWESYPVFHVDFNGTNFEDGMTLANKVEDYVTEWEAQYNFAANKQLGAGDRFVQLLAHVHNTTGKRCVVLIDEYDKPLLDVMDTGLKVKVNGGAPHRGLQPQHSQRLLLHLQGSRCTSAVCAAHGRDQVLAGERVQRL